MYGWNFPPSGFGETIGLNNSGVETFRSSLLESLAREIIQNSCDAKHPDADGPVEVRFELFSLPANKLPGRVDLQQVMESSRSFWSHLPESVKFFDRALSVLNSTEIPMLKISDYQTTGLTGAREEIRGSWNALVKSSGVSEKSSESGGSFGIGKNAPFACSHLRTIYYGTLDREGVSAFQGVARLVSHKNAKDQLTQGTGFFGKTEKNLPLITNEELQAAEIDAIFHRETTGTDLFVPGFQADLDWKERIVKAVLEHFFVAVLEKKLIVRVDSIEVNADTFESLLAEFGQEDDEPILASKYYQAFLAPSEAPHFFVEENFEGMGRMELHLISGKDFPKRIAMFRSTGMKIHDKRFQSIMPFAGVFIAKGEELNKFLRSLEPPNHQSWDTDRSSDKRKAKRLLTKLYDWVREHLRSITVPEETETLDVEGMSQFLPDNSEDTALISGEGEGLRILPKEVPVRTIKRVANVADVSNEEVAVTQEEIEDGDDEPDFPQDNSEETEDSAEPNEDQEESDETGDPETQDEPDQNSGDTPARKKKKIKSLKQVFAFCTNPSQGIYHVNFTPNADGEASLLITLVGEDGGAAAPILSASLPDLPSTTPKINAKGKVGPFPMQGGKKNTLVLQLEPGRYALEVALHAN